MPDTKTTQTIAEFIAVNQIEMSALQTHANPNIDSMGRGATHWSCEIRQVGKGNADTLVTFYSMGSGLKGAPELADVLDCLASDASGADNARDFEDWASEYGYDTDSRKAEKIYNACVEGRDKLKAFLGAPAYEALLWNTERQ